MRCPGSYPDTELVLELVFFFFFSQASTDLDLFARVGGCGINKAMG